MLRLATQLTLVLITPCCLAASLHPVALFTAVGGASSAGGWVFNTLPGPACRASTNVNLLVFVNNDCSPNASDQTLATVAAPAQFNNEQTRYINGTSVFDRITNASLTPSSYEGIKVELLNNDSSCGVSSCQSMTCSAETGVCTASGAVGTDTVSGTCSPCA